ncbi:phenylalanine--tRNA ligase subunit alpha [Candidatus Pacearchaeota archaeon]|nr:phenylalanine--tRNA ligase subunit alpha [Candidatus Pacearchaeota archaeon]
MEKNKEENESLDSLIEKLSPIELKIIPFLNNNLEKIKEKSGLDEVSLLRGLKFMETKGILNIKTITKSIIDLGTNGIYYKKHHLPERKLLMFLENNKHPSIEEAKDLSKLSDNEFKVSLGVLKDKALISITNGKISLIAQKNILSKKSLEEQFLERLPLSYEELKDEEKLAFENLKKRKEIIELKKKNDISFTLTPIGEKIAGKQISSDYIEEITPEVIKSWIKKKKIRKYDLSIPVPKIYGGKKHFTQQAISYAKKIWLDLGFKEMEGNIVVSGFWNFDALFTPQDHPAREMQDTFYLKGAEAQLNDKKLVENVKMAHEGKLKEKSSGWQYKWEEDDAKRVVLRTHTTALSSQTLKKIADNKEFPAKYFAIGKCFRNETIDWSHGFEFYQTEGIVVDENVNMKQLLGYLIEFYKKMGYEKIRIRPHYFPYTEPSVEIDAWNNDRKIWIEVGGAGIFRPEVTIPFFGKNIRVLAWGPGFDRIIMEFFEIKDLREMYSNNINQLRSKRFWIK